MPVRLEYEIRGADSTEIRIRATRDAIRTQIEDILRDALDVAEKEMRAYLAEHSRSGETLASVRKGGIIYAPGGPGGGGFWQVELSVGEGVPYFNIFVEGSGIHGIFSASHGSIKAGLGNIRPKGNPSWLPRTGARAMHFTDEFGEEIFRYQVRGQEAHDDWIAVAQEAADAVVRERITRIDSVGIT